MFISKYTRSKELWAGVQTDLELLFNGTAETNLEIECRKCRGTHNAKDYLVKHTRGGLLRFSSLCSVCRGERKQPMPTLKFDGQLEIDQDRGVIYFHSAEHGVTLLRICNLPRPIPNPIAVMNPPAIEGLDITHMHHASWRGSRKLD